MSGRHVVVDVVHEKPWWQACDIKDFRGRIATMDHGSLIVVVADLDAAISKTAATNEDVTNDVEQRRRARWALAHYTEKRNAAKFRLSEIGATQQTPKALRQLDRVAEARRALDADDIKMAVSLILDIFEKRP